MFLAVWFAALAACAPPCLAQKAEEDIQAAVAALVPGQIIRRDYGWVISSPERGNVYVMRERDGYTISGKGVHYRLIERSDGFAISQGDPNRRPIPLEAFYFERDVQRAPKSRVVSRVRRR